MIISLCQPSSIRKLPEYKQLLNAEFPAKQLGMLLAGHNQ